MGAPYYDIHDPFRVLPCYQCTTANRSRRGSSSLIYKTERRSKRELGQAMTALDTLKQHSSEIEIEELIKKTPHRVLWLRQEVCRTCAGSGLQACYNCDGLGSYKTYGVVVFCKVNFSRLTEGSTGVLDKHDHKPSRGADLDFVLAKHPHHDEAFRKTCACSAAKATSRLLSNGTGGVSANASPVITWPTDQHHQVWHKRNG